MSPARRRLFLTLAGLAVLAVVAGGAVAVGAAMDQPAPVRQDELGSVLLVPGYGGSLTALEPLRKQLQEDGRTVVIVPAPDGGTGDIDAQAENLAAAAGRALAASDVGSVDVVGYSAGGVVARVWVKSHGGDSVARRVLTVGSPHHGSEVARLVYDGLGDCPTACQELVPDSPLLRRLNAGDETPDGPRFASIWSTSDQVSTPPATARLDGALNIPVQSLCPDARTSHGGLPSDPVVTASLGSVLGPGPPEVPQDVDCG